VWYETMAESEITCKQLVELVTSYLEDSLPPVQRSRFEEHLATCSGCQEYLDQMRQTIQLLGALPQESIAPPARQQLLAAFRAWYSGRTRDA
jgi:anti-sigma factor RsiW